MSAARLGLLREGVGGARSGRRNVDHFEVEGLAILGEHQAHLGDDIAIVVHLHHHQCRPVVPERDFSFLELALVPVETAGNVHGLFLGPEFGNLDAVRGLLDQQGFELESFFVVGTELPRSVKVGPIRSEGGCGGKGNQKKQGAHVVSVSRSSCPQKVRRRIRRIPYGGRREIECGPAPSARFAIAETHIPAPAFLGERGSPFLAVVCGVICDFQPRSENRVWPGANPPVARIADAKVPRDWPMVKPIRWSHAVRIGCCGVAGAAPRRWATKVIYPRNKLDPR